MVIILLIISIIVFLYIIQPQPSKNRSRQQADSGFSVIQTTARIMMDAAVTEVSVIPAAGAAIERRLFSFH